MVPTFQHHAHTLQGNEPSQTSVFVMLPSFMNSTLIANGSRFFQDLCRTALGCNKGPTLLLFEGIFEVRSPRPNPEKAGLS